MHMGVAKLVILSFRLWLRLEQLVNVRLNLDTEKVLSTVF